MGIRVICPNCALELNIKSSQAGKRGICPSCQARIDIPAASAELDTSISIKATDETSVVNTPVDDSVGDKIDALFEMLNSNEPDAPPIIAEKIGKYRLEKQIGEGAFGVVYLAVDEDLDRQVARTAGRPLASGALTRREAAIFLVVNILSLPV